MRARKPNASALERSSESHNRPPSPARLPDRGPDPRGPAYPAAAKPAVELTALGTLHHAGWITNAQYETGLMFGDLWKHQDRHYVALRNEVMVDLMKIDALDLACRVCRDNQLRVAFDRIGALRHALDLIALRFKQIELAAAATEAEQILVKQSRRQAGRAARADTPPLVADTETTA
jgi:hypothetical protein